MALHGERYRTGLLSACRLQQHQQQRFRLMSSYVAAEKVDNTSSSLGKMKSSTSYNQHRPIKTCT